MSSWQGLIGACMPENMAAFVSSRTEEDTAFMLLSTLRRESIGWREFEIELRSQIDPDGNKKEVADKISCDAKRYFGPWLLD